MTLSNIDIEWKHFINNNCIDIHQMVSPKIYNNKHTPKCSDIYISTQTKIIFMNQSFDLEKIFWKIPILKYQTRGEGILKKQMKVNCNTKEESDKLNEKITTEEMIVVDTIAHIDNPNARKVKYKDIRKINIGISKKDLTSYRKKRKGAFYNCFVLIMRLKSKNGYKEVHLKIFNTGKLEIPGIQSSQFLYKALDKLIHILQPFCNQPLAYERDEVETVLINSNFSCNYFIDRNEFYNILKYKYKIHAIYDPCSYPGIQCKFYYNEDNLLNNGICSCGENCKKKGGCGKGINQCLAVSFMIFRTGSVLIVGHCNEGILMNVYSFLKDILIKECANIFIKKKEKDTKKKRKKVWRSEILLDIKPVNES